MKYDKYEPIVYRCTDDNYLTETLFSREVGTIGASAIWKLVLEYRKEHEVLLSPLKTLNREPVYFTGTSTILERLKSFESLISNFAKQLESLNGRRGEYVRRAIYESCLAGINIFEECEMSPLMIKAVLNGTYRNHEEFHDPLLRYHDLLEKLFREGESDLPNEDFMAQVLEAIEGTQELISFYRSSDFDKEALRWSFQQSPDYGYCPAERIADSMSQLFNAIQGNDQVSLIVKALAALIFIDWFKPFDSHNEVVALMVAKKILSSEFGPGAYLLPIETFLTELRRTDYRFLILEVRRKGDLTYLFDTFMSRMRRCWNDFLQAQKDAEKEVYEEEQREENVSSPEKENYSILEEESDISLDEPKPIFAEEVKEEETIPNSSIQPMEEKRKVPPSPPRFPSGQNLMPFETERLTEKETREYTQYLMETDPSLSRKQASFLASHLIEGRYYTIQQFKRFARCSYETARTSMDKLAARGYYKKSQIKNKFVYTPVMKGQE